MYDIRIVSGVQHCNEDKVPDSVQSTAEKIAQSMMRLLHITDAHFSLILCNLILDKLSWIIIIWIDAYYDLHLYSDNNYDYEIPHSEDCSYTSLKI